MAARRQTDMGWGLLVKGFVTTKWRVVQDKFEAERGDRYRSNVWLSRIVEAGWNYMHKMWCHRNEVLHGPDGEAAQNMHRLLDGEIKQEKEAGPDGLANDIEEIWQEDETVLLGKTTEYKKQWIRMIRAGRHTGREYDYTAEKKGLDSWMATGRL